MLPGGRDQNLVAPSRSPLVLDGQLLVNLGTVIVNEQLATVCRAEPRYVQVKSYILELIKEGRLSSGDRVPSENELTDLLGVSRMTVNRALREMADDGILSRLAGVGTFVADSRPHSHVLRVKNIADEIRSRGHQHSAKVKVLEAVEANSELAHRLEVREGDPLYHSVIPHLESAQPIQLEERYVCPRLAPDYLKVDFTKTTPNVYLSRVAPLHSSEHVVRAVLPSRKTRRLLNMDDSEPCLLIRRRTWSGGRPVCLADLSHPGSRYELIGALADNKWEQ